MSGAVYNGQVNVYARNIDPTTKEGIATMPGDLRGIDTSGDEKLLHSFGIMAVELSDNNGNPLQIANGATATISQIIPTSLLGIAGTTIPMWYFDEIKGMWMEEGNATLNGNKYEGKVKHFTYWNYDVKAPAISMQMVIKDQNGNPLLGAVVALHNGQNIGTQGVTGLPPDGLVVWLKQMLNSI